MDIFKKILQLRKANHLTQEELAEKLNISRQSVSKWESGQSTPDLEKILLMSNLFHVTTDYLLKPSEIDELVQKTDLLEQKQDELISDMKYAKEKRRKILICTGIYLLAFAILILLGNMSWNNEFLFDTFPGITLHLFIFLIATALAVFVCAGSRRKKKE